MANSQPKKLALIASKGSLDWAYPPFVLASTAAALDYQVQKFFTFYGLTLLKKDFNILKVSPLGNLPMPIPNFVQMLLGIENMASMMKRKTITCKGMASI